MPVVALSEIGLIIDVFGSRPKVHKSVDYVMSNGIVASYYNELIKFIDLQTQNVHEERVQKVKEMKMSKNGKYLLVETLDSNILLFKDTKLIHSLKETVEEFNINNSYFYYTSSNGLVIFDLDKMSVCHKQDKLPKQIVLLEDSILIITDTMPSKLIFYSTKKSDKVINLKTIPTGAFEYFDEITQVSKNTLIEYEKVNKISVVESNGDLLILAETSYSSITYFAELTLYYLQKRSDNTFRILKYKNEKLGDLLHVGFIKNEFFVVSGKQPSNCTLFDRSTGNKTRSLKKVTRNYVEFNKSEQKVLCGAYGNLPGVVTILDNGKITCQFESLGSSVFKWLNDGSRFLVATTNYFKEGNKIDIYDYYGRKLETMECKSLYKVDVYGKPEDEKVFNKPEKPIVINKQEMFTIPQLNMKSMGNINNLSIPKKQVEKIRAKTAAKEIRTCEIVEKELSIALELRSKMQEGTDLSVDDQNKVFSISSLQEEIEGLKLNKKH